MSWDPQTYLKFDAERTRPAKELLDRIGIQAPARAMDLGCGPGNSTALLAARWPDAALEGLDNSADMLAKAEASGVRARFCQGDIAGWAPATPYDVIYSNAAFHWVPDHDALLARLVSSLAPGGVLAFQVPRQFDAPCHRMLVDLAGEPRWRERLKGARENFTIHPAEDYFLMLEPQTTHLDIWETIYIQALNGDDAVYHWMSGTGARPYIQALHGEEQTAFVAEYKARLAAAYPVHASGKTLFPFRRLFVVATR
jgi:trans-aconitate 2-methyltransferase